MLVLALFLMAFNPQQVTSRCGGPGTSCVIDQQPATPNGVREIRMPEGTHCDYHGSELVCMIPRDGDVMVGDTILDLPDDQQQIESGPVIGSPITSSGPMIDYRPIAEGDIIQ